MPDRPALRHRNAWKRQVLAVYNPVVNRLRHVFRWARTCLTTRWTPCSVCGKSGPKRFAPEAVSDELVMMWGLDVRGARDLRCKESLFCPWCGSKHRARRLASALLREIDASPDRPKSLAEFFRIRGNLAEIAGPILILNRIDGMDAVLSNRPGIVLTDYADGTTPGTVTNGVRHEDAQRLTFADATFRMVISSETLEHIPDLEAALSEIRRVLKPGGCHLFTIPQKEGVQHTFTRIRTGDRGDLIELAHPRLSHPGGSWGWPVFTEFGDDFVLILDRSGWKTHIDRMSSEDLETYGSNCVCVVYVAYGSA